MWFGTNNARRMTLTSNGRLLLASAADANRFPGSGSFEIAGRLRLDGNEIITNTGATLFLNRDNGGDVRMDGRTFHLDASTNRIGIGTSTPADTLHLRSSAASTVGVLMGNGLLPFRHDRKKKTRVESAWCSFRGYPMAEVIGSITGKNKIFGFTEFLEGHRAIDKH